MKFLAYRFLFFLLSFSGSFYSGHSQNKIDTSELLGSWILENQVFLEPDEDSLSIKEESKGHIITFKKGNSFLTRKKVGAILKTIGTGTYKISEDGKYLYQNDTESEIIELTDKLFIIRIDEAGIELHFKRHNSLK